MRATHRIFVKEPGASNRGDMGSAADAAVFFTCAGMFFGYHLWLYTLKHFFNCTRPDKLVLWETAFKARYRPRFYRRAYCERAGETGSTVAHWKSSFRLTDGRSV